MVQECLLCKLKFSRIVIFWQTFLRDRFNWFNYQSFSISIHSKRIITVSTRIASSTNFFSSSRRRGIKILQKYFQSHTHTHTRNTPTCRSQTIRIMGYARNFTLETGFRGGVVFSGDKFRGCTLRRSDVRIHVNGGEHRRVGGDGALACWWRGS